MKYEELKQRFEKLVSDCENPRCPECGSEEISHCHHDGDFRAPECDFFQCGECDHQWGHE